MATDFLFFQIFSCMVLTYNLTFAVAHKIAKAQSLKQSLHKKIFWTVPLRYLIEGYVELSICAVIGFVTMQWDFITTNIIVSNMVSIILTLILIVFPLILVCLYPCNYKRLD